MYKFIGKVVISTIGLGTVLCGGIVLGIGGLALVVGKDDTVSKNLIEDCKDFYQKFQESKKVKEQKEEVTKSTKTEQPQKQDNQFYEEWLNSHKL